MYLSTINRKLMSKYGTMMVPEGVMKTQPSSREHNIKLLEDFIIRIFVQYKVAIVSGMGALVNIEDKDLSDYLKSLEDSIISYYGFHKSFTLFRIGELSDNQRELGSLPQILSAINALTGYSFVYQTSYPGLDIHDQHLNGVLTIRIQRERDTADLIIDDLCNQISINPDDFEWMECILETVKDDWDFSSLNIPNRENKAMLVKWLFSVGKQDEIESHFTTSKDVLRFVKPFVEEKKVTRKLKTVVARILNNMDYPNKIEDYYRDREEWLFVFKILQIGDYFRSHKRLAEDVELLRNGQKPSFFQSKLHQAKANKDLDAMIKLLEDRPGEFVRNFLFMVNLAPNRNVIDDLIWILFRKRDQITQKSLIELTNAIMVYNSNFRLFKPKTKLYTRASERNQMSKDIANQIIIGVQNVLEHKLTSKNNYKTVYIANELRHIPMPLVLRDLNESALSLPRYSKIQIKPDTKFIRLFTAWNDKSSIDIDLSVIFLDGGGNPKGKLYYNNIQDGLKNYGVRHSGDIRCSPGSEYVDINIAALKERGIRYAVTLINTFSGVDSFKAMDECIAGAMELENLNDKSKYFDFSKVRMKSNIETEVNDCIPLLFDVQTRELVWIDKPSGEITKQTQNVNNIHYGYFNTIVASEFARMGVTVFDYFQLFGKVNASKVKYISDEDILQLQPEDLRDSLTVGLFNGDIKSIQQSKIIDYLN